MHVDANGAYTSGRHGLSFAVSNANSAHVPCPLTVTCKLAISDSSGCAVDYTTASEIATDVDSSTPLVIDSKSEATAGFKLDDRRACYVRTPEWTVKTYAQSTSAPCHANEMSVSLRSNVPIFYSKRGCGTTLTLSGLKKSASCTDEHPTVTIHDGTTTLTNAVTRDWAVGTGILIMTPLAVPEAATETFMMAGKTYSIRFTLINPSAPQDEVVTVTKTESPAIAEQDLVGKFEVEKATVEIVSFTSSSAYPCDASSLEVTLKSNHNLLARCAPTMTISGLQNSVDEGLGFFGEEGKGWQSNGTLGGGLTQVVFDGYMFDAGHEGTVRFSSALLQAHKPVTIRFQVPAILSLFDYFLCLTIVFLSLSPAVSFASAHTFLLLRSYALFSLSYSPSHCHLPRFVIFL
jgi:hypothetical protein